MVATCFILLFLSPEAPTNSLLSLKFSGKYLITVFRNLGSGDTSNITCKNRHECDWTFHKNNTKRLTSSDFKTFGFAAACLAAASFLALKN